MALGIILCDDLTHGWLAAWPGWCVGGPFTRQLRGLRRFLEAELLHLAGHLLKGRKGRVVLRGRDFAWVFHARGVQRREVDGVVGGGLHLLVEIALDDLEPLLFRHVLRYVLRIDKARVHPPLPTVLGHLKVSHFDKLL